MEQTLGCPVRIWGGQPLMADCTRSAPYPKAAARSPALRLRVATTTVSDLGLLPNRQRAIDLDHKVSHDERKGSAYLYTALAMNAVGIRQEQGIARQF